MMNVLLREPEDREWGRLWREWLLRGTPPSPELGAIGSTYIEGERSASAGAHRIFQLVPQRVLGSIELIRLWVGNFAAAAIGVRVEFAECPAFLQLSLPSSTWAQGSCTPQGSSNAFLTTDNTAVPPTPTHLVPAGGAIDIDLRGTVVDPGRMLQITAATFPSDLSAGVAWRNQGAKQEGPTFIARYRAP
jgi:hypothetical protein